MVYPVLFFKNISCLASQVVYSKGIQGSNNLELDQTKEIQTRLRMTDRHKQSKACFF